MARPEEPSAAVTDDGFLDGRLAILQPRRGHRAGHDAVLLGATVGEDTQGRVVELGAGVGVAGLSAAVRAPGVEAVLVEIDAASAALAEENARRNGLAERVRVLRLDIAMRAGERAAAGLQPECADIVLLNPPFYTPGREKGSPDPGRRLAHHEGAGGLEAWLDAAVATARQGGRIVVIHRPEALPRLLAGLSGRVGGLTILPVHPRADRDAVRVIISGMRGSRTPLRLLPSLDLSGAEAKSILSGRAPLRSA